jgi:uncharacterized protein YbcI
MEATKQAPALAISNAVVQITRDYTGRGPTGSRAHISHDLVTVVLDDVLTKGERQLVRGGQSEKVLELRHDFQVLMRDELVASVETELRRDVIAFMSCNHIDPDLAVETFVLEPAG